MLAVERAHLGQPHTVTVRATVDGIEFRSLCALLRGISEIGHCSGPYCSRDLRLWGLLRAGVALHVHEILAVLIEDGLHVSEADEL
jgi:hypothetical protein